MTKRDFVAERAVQEQMKELRQALRQGKFQRADRPSRPRRSKVLTLRDSSMGFFKAEKQIQDNSGGVYSDEKEFS